jgi:predicted Zn-dependent protease
MIEPQEIIEQALAASTADGCIVIAADHSETNLRWANNSLTTNGQMASRCVTVIATVDGPNGASAGVLTRSVTTSAEVEALVRASDAAARTAAPADDGAPLVEPYEHADDWAAEAARTGVSVFDRVAPPLAAAFARARRDDERLFGFAEHQMTSTFLGTSTGLRRRHDQPDGRLEFNGKSADLARSAWAGRHTVDFTDIEVGAVAEELHTRLGWARHRVELPAGRYETILPPSAVADLMVYVYWTASARDADEGRNVFAKNPIGTQLSSLPLTLRSDPAEPGLACAPFQVVTASEGGLQSVFDNGAAAGATEWVSNGMLTNLVRTRAWAAKTDQPHRPLVGNLVLDGPGSASVADLVSGTERGLLLTCLWYIREVDPQTLLLTGLTRDGVYVIENGQVTGAANNFRFNESPVALLDRVSEIGRTEPTLPREWSDYFSRAAMPAIRVPDFNMSTVSRAS